MKTKMQVKNTNPFPFVNRKAIDPIILLYFQLNHLKQLYRQGWLRKGRNISQKRCESVADHTFGVWILALLVCQHYFPHLNLVKVLKMCLVHEFPEVINGDPCSPKTDAEKRQKYLDERAAIIKLLKGFPDGNEYMDLWDEYTRLESPEAKLVKQLDKLEMAFQAKIYSLQHKRNLQVFLDDAREHIESKELKNILNQLDGI